MQARLLSSSFFIRAKQQDGRVHLGLIAGLPLLTNPPHCRRNKEINNRDLKKQKAEEFSCTESNSQAFKSYGNQLF